MSYMAEHSFEFAPDSRLSYLEAGPSNGRLVILCHGWPAIAQTWKPQIEALAGAGYRVVAPDMPGYGKSTVLSDTRDYSLRNINKIMAALLQHCGQDAAIWVGHDWGAVSVWSFAAVIGVAVLVRPYRTLELGLEEALRYIHRGVYPEDEYPYGQYDYQAYFEKSPESATKLFESDPQGLLKAIYMKGNADEVGHPAVTSTITQDGGWFKGSSVVPPGLKHIPFESLCLDETMFNQVVHSMIQTGFRGANSWYLNHEENRQYGLNESKNDGHLRMPVLFIGANWDPISDVAVSNIAEPQKEYCSQLKEFYFDAGHWIGLERAEEVNATIIGWLKELC